MIPIARPILGEDELAAVREVLASGMLAQGPNVEAFEKAFARDLGRKHAIAVTNGTAALHVALLAHGIGPGREVVIPPLTFFATASTVLFCGARPVFVDIDRASYNMDPTKVVGAMTRKTAAILPVHLYGQTAEMDPILEAAAERGIPVIEDAAQAAGAEYHGKRAGKLGATACFSFYPTKNMTTGEGGMIVTDDDDVAAKSRLLRSHGEASKYQHVALGYNYRMTEIAAAIGLVQPRVERGAGVIPSTKLHEGVSVTQERERAGGGVRSLPDEVGVKGRGVVPSEGPLLLKPVAERGGERVKVHGAPPVRRS